MRTRRVLSNVWPFCHEVLEAESDLGVVAPYLVDDSYYDFEEDT